MPADLLTSPRWKAEHLGLPMPDDRDAVSACLPHWAHNVAYEEGDAQVLDQLQAAYPRFCIHPDVRALCDKLFPDHAGLPFVSAAAAQRAVEYVQHAGGSTARLQPIPDQPCVAVAIDPSEFRLLKEYWQHSGELISSRMARSILAGTTVTMSETAARATVRQRIADLHDVSADHVFLFSSGMGAIAAAWRAVSRIRPHGTTCQFGFPYVDTLKIQERFPRAYCAFLPMGTAEDVQRLAHLFPHRNYSAVFCETPTNPLLATPDLPRLRDITSQNDAVLIVDDTLRACSRQSVLPQCDIVATSLTKYFSGYGNVLAGALILNPASEHFESLQAALTEDFEESLSDLDTEVLEQNSRDFRERICQSVRNAEILVERLRDHPAVADVFYPQETDDQNTGHGALFSVVLRDADRVTPQVFDRLQVSKGPNLGTNFTLCCPYTILAHYTELDFAEHCGASRWLLRFSVGMEPVDDLWDRLTTALESILEAQ